MSYLDGADAYQGDADSASSGFSETYLANIDTTLYSPYSSDETISSQFFKTSTDSMSSSGSHPENSSAFAGDPYVRSPSISCSFQSSSLYNSDFLDGYIYFRYGTIDFRRL